MDTPDPSDPPEQKPRRKAKSKMGRRPVPRRPNRVDVRKVMKQAVAQAGGPPELSRRLGITRHAIYQWDRVPVEHVLVLSGLTGIPASRLRPDIYRARVDDGV